MDLQGFCWGVFNHAKVWFGGATYDGARSMLPQFLDKGVFAAHFANQPEVAAILRDAATLQPDERSPRRADLEALLPEAASRKALLNLFDLASTKHALVLVKSVWRHNGRGVSVAQIKAVGETTGTSGNDPDLGHMVGVEWLSQPMVTLNVGRLWGAINATLTPVDLEAALGTSWPSPRTTRPL